MEQELTSDIRRVETGGLLIENLPVDIERDRTQIPIEFGLPINKITLTVNENNANLYFSAGLSDAGVLSNIIRQNILAGFKVTGHKIVSNEHSLISRQVSFNRVGSLLVGHYQDENLRTGKTMHGFSFGRFGLTKALGIKP